MDSGTLELKGERYGNVFLYLRKKLPYIQNSAVEMPGCFTVSAAGTSIGVTGERYRNVNCPKVSAAGTDFCRMVSATGTLKCGTDLPWCYRGRIR